MFHPNVTSNSEDSVSKSTGDLIRKIPQSKDCCFLKWTNHFDLIVMWEIPVPRELANWNRKLFVMDNHSLQQIIERIPELKFKYIGSFPADFIPILTKFSLAIINTALKKEVGEHWILIARINRNYYFADSLAQSIAHYKFLGKKYQKIIHWPLQKMQNLCGFYAIVAAFQLFKIFQTNLNNNHDVHDLNFIINYM